MATNKEKIVFEVEIDGKQAENSLGGLEDRIEKLRELQRGEQIGSKAFIALSKDIQKAEAAVKDVELQFESLDLEQKMTAGMDAVTGLTGGFMAAQGAMALVGSESELLEESLVKVAAAMALSQGIRDLGNGAIALRKLGGAAAIAKKAQLALNAAMKANPIGAVVAAVAALVAVIAILVIRSRDYADSVNVSIQRTKALEKATDQATNSIQSQVTQVEALVKVAKDEESTLQQKKEAIKQLNEISPQYLGDLTVQNVLTEKGTKLLKAFTDSLKARALAQALEETLVEQTKERLRLQKEELGFADVWLSGWTEQWAIVKSLAAGEDLMTAAVAGGNQKRKYANELKKENLEVQDAAIQATAEELDAAKKLTLVLDGETRAYEHNVIAAKKSGDASKDAAKDRLRGLEPMKILTKERIEIISDGLSQEVDLNTEALATIQTNEDIAAELKRRKDLANQEIVKQDIIALAKFRDKQANKQLDKAQQGLDLLSGLNNAFVGDEIKREKIRKKLAIAQIAIDTARAVSGAIAAGAAIPFPGNIPAILAGVTAVLAGIGQAKAILGAGDSGLSAASITGAATGTDGAQLNNISNTASLIDQDQQNLSQPVLVVESFNEANNNIALAEELSSF